MHLVAKGIVVGPVEQQLGFHPEVQLEAGVLPRLEAFVLQHSNYEEVELYPLLIYIAYRGYNN